MRATAKIMAIVDVKTDQNTKIQCRMNEDVEKWVIKPSKRVSGREFGDVCVKCFKLSPVTFNAVRAYLYVLNFTHHISARQ